MRLCTFLACGLLLCQGSAVGQTKDSRSHDHSSPSEYANWQVPASAAKLKNPFFGQAEHIKGGRKLYDRHCASCHGKEGEGTRKIMAVRSERILKAGPGALFWFLKNGSSTAGMPGWSRLPDQQLWQLVTFLQSPR